MTTVTFIGAGSTVFTRNIAGDILSRPALRDATVRLMDIDPKRLEESAVVVGRLAQALGDRATVETFSDRRRALAGADFVVTCFQIGGYDPCTITDFEVPRRHGLRQTIADTLGIGGIMRGLRRDVLGQRERPAYGGRRRTDRRCGSAEAGRAARPAGRRGLHPRGGLADG
jgi:alpha-galactosidase